MTRGHCNVCRAMISIFAILPMHFHALSAAWKPNRSPLAFRALRAVSHGTRMECISALGSGLDMPGQGGWGSRLVGSHRACVPLYSCVCPCLRVDARPGVFWIVVQRVRAILSSIQASLVAHSTSPAFRCGAPSLCVRLRACRRAQCGFTTVFCGLESHSCCKASARWC